MLRLFSIMVDSVLSFGAEVWGTQLAAKAAASNGSTGSAPEVLHLSFLRQLLGVRQGTPNAVVLAETGERPLWHRWLVRATKLWNRACSQPHSSLLRQAVVASAALAAAPGSRPLARQSWAEQLATGLAAAGVQLNLANPQPVSHAAVRAGVQQRQLELLKAAATREGASKLQHYTLGIHGGCLETATLSTPAAYISSVRERCRRVCLAQLITGSHWLREETGRWERLPREQRLCPHCSNGIEDVEHVIYHCPLYASLRQRFSDLFHPVPCSLHAFFQQAPPRLASFAAACYRTWQDATTPPPTDPPFTHTPPITSGPLPPPNSTIAHNTLPPA
jgi:hypothetical protein